VAELLIDATSFAKAFPVFAINWFDGSAAERAKALIATARLNAQLTDQFAELILKEIDQRDSSAIGRGPIP